MSVNSSSSSLMYLHHCYDSTVGFFIAVSYNVTKVILLLPLSLLIFYLGHRRWRQQRSLATTSHSDVFTFHSAATEIIYALGAVLFYSAKYFGLSEMMTFGCYLFCVVVPGQTSFHILTCVERYLAVVHPSIYLGLRQSGGVRIRNISIGCVWLLCFGWICVIAQYSPNFPYVLFLSLLVFSLVIVSFCSFSVLCILIRPGPGEKVGDRTSVNQIKQRAFYTMTAITGVLWLFFLGLLGCVALDDSSLLSYSDGCLVLASGNWFSLPSSLALPLLFLHRAGKSVCYHCSNK